MSIPLRSGPPGAGPALFNLGFRPFFLGAGLFAALAMGLWSGVYLGGWQLALAQMTPITWHAHEMLYGYTMAVIAGFLLTAVRNWTDRATASGARLALLVALWAAARGLALFEGSGAGRMMALADLSFQLALLVELARPLVQARQWRQSGILAKVALLVVTNGLFYLGLLGYLDRGIHWGLYGGLYLIIGLILTMGRRVIPFFTERGVGYPVSLVNRRWVDVASLVVFLGFVVLDVFTPYRVAAAGCALILLALHGLRLWGWYTPGIWRKPLLWSLYLAYGFIVAGFPLYALSVFTGVTPYLAVHAFALGGIGLITLGMMARVALGHTGRDVQHPPRAVVWPLALLTASALLRVFAPLLLPGLYSHWIVASQLLWIAAFGVFVALYWPILGRPRVDGRPG